MSGMRGLPRFSELDALLPNEGLLPSQLSLRSGMMNGEARLAYAVLEDAWNCFTFPAAPNDIKALKLQREAEAWLLSPLFFPVSLVFACSILGWSADAIQDRVRAIAQERANQPARAYCWQRGFCRYGHPLMADNIKQSGKQRRRCKQCANQYQRSFKQRWRLSA